jgi:hypothetical protein
MTQPNKFWTTGKKIALTIVLAVIATWLFGCDYVRKQTRTYVDNDSDVNADELKKIYNNYNDLYFDNKLPTDTKFYYDLTGSNMADTGCDDEGKNCVMRFNPKFTAAYRVAQGTMLHEMCHEKVWTKLLDKDRPAMEDQRAYDHSFVWQGCMLSLDTMGAFRHVNIDYYTGN